MEASKPWNRLLSKNMKIKALIQNGNYDRAEIAYRVLKLRDSPDKFTFSSLTMMYLNSDYTKIRTLLVEPSFSEHANAKLLLTILHGYARNNYSQGISELLFYIRDKKLPLDLLLARRILYCVKDFRISAVSVLEYVESYLKAQGQTYQVAWYLLIDAYSQSERSDKVEELCIHCLLHLDLDADLSRKSIFFYKSASEDAVQACRARFNVPMFQIVAAIIVKNLSLSVTKKCHLLETIYADLIQYLQSHDEVSLNFTDQELLWNLESLDILFSHFFGNDDAGHLKSFYLVLEKRNFMPLFENIQRRPLGRALALAYLKVYLTVVRSFTKHSSYYHLCNVVENLQKLGLVDIFHYNCLLQVTYENCRGSFRELETILFKTMSKYGCVPNIVSYNILLNAYSKYDSQKKFDFLLRVIRKDQNVSLSLATYGIILSDILKDGGMRNARAKIAKTLKQMERDGLRPDTCIYNILLHATIFETGNLSVIAGWPNFFPDIYTINIILTFYANKGDYRTLFEFAKKKFFEDKLIPDVISLQILWNACHKQENKNSKWGNTFMEILQHLQALNNIDQEVFIFWMMRDQCDSEEKQHSQYIDAAQYKRISSTRPSSFPRLDLAKTLLE